MSRPRPWRAAAAAVALAGPALAPAGAGAAPVVVTGWPQVEAAFAGSTLVWATTATNRLRGFSYWSAEASTVRMGRRGPTGAVTTPVVLRTEAGPFSRPALSTAPDGRFALIARAAAFPPPVVMCCDRRGVEVVVESDGRVGAPRAVAAAVDGDRVHMVLAGATGTRLVSEDPRRLTDEASVLAAALPRAEAPFPGVVAEPAAASGRLLAWVDPASPGVVRLAELRAGAVTEAAPLADRGRVLRVWADAPSTVVTAVAGGAGTTLVAHDVTRRTSRVVWRGRGVPPVAVGGGTVAVAEGRRVLVAGAERRRAAGEVAALATDGRRVVVFERVTSRRGVRSTVARFVAVAP